MLNKNNPIIEPIGFLIEGDEVVVANPCRIPISILKEQLEKPTKENEVTACFMIKLPFNTKDFQMETKAKLKEQQK